MTSNDRIEAALAALDKSSPGPWELFEDIFLTQPDIQDRNGRSVATVRLPYPMSEVTRSSNATLIAAAPDLAAEVIRLRKWKDDAFCHVEISRNYLSTELKAMKDDGSGAIDQLKQLKDEADRLIAEAQEDKNA